MAEYIERKAAVVPVADVKPVRRGEWQHLEDVDWQCSVCGADALAIGCRQVKSNFCPNCGADMREES